MNRSALRWLLPVIRYGLCIVAIAYLVWLVDWHDHVKRSDGTRLALLSQDEAGDRYEVLLNGVRESLRGDQLQGVAGRPTVSRGIRNVVVNADFRLALLSILIFMPLPLMSALRLIWMLAIQDVRLSYWNSTKLTFAGNFFNFALPGTTGGDLIKAYYVTRFTKHKTEAVTTIFLDRVVGLLGLMFVASATFVYAWNRVEWDIGYRNTLASGIGLTWAGLAVGCVFVFSKRLRNLIRLPQLAANLPAGEQLLRIGRATVAMRQRKSLLLASLGITVALQLLVVISAWVMALALQMKGSPELYFICVPIGFLISAIPITPPQGAGVMETAYTYFFARGGLNPASAAVAFALAVRLIQLVWALPGVLVPLLGAHLPSQRDLDELSRSDSGEAPA